jgi:hypothetical protein
MSRAYNQGFAMDLDVVRKVQSTAPSVSLLKEEGRLYLRMLASPRWMQFKITLALNGQTGIVVPLGAKCLGKTLMGTPCRLRT